MPPQPHSPLPPKAQGQLPAPGACDEMVLSGSGDGGDKWRTEPCSCGWHMSTMLWGGVQGDDKQEVQGPVRKEQQAGGEQRPPFETCKRMKHSLSLSFVPQSRKEDSSTAGRQSRRRRVETSFPSMRAFEPPILVMCPAGEAGGEQQEGADQALSHSLGAPLPNQNDQQQHRRQYYDRNSPPPLPHAGVGAAATAAAAAVPATAGAARRRSSVGFGGGRPSMGQPEVSAWAPCMYKLNKGKLWAFGRSVSIG
eukprot:1158314-Pelagomonas_calceolata.AAC.7